MKTKLYLIIFGTATTDEKGVCSAYCGCEKYFYSRVKALKALTEAKDSYIKDFKDNATEVNYEDCIQVYGSEQEEYYEVDITINDDNMSECYFRLQEIEIF